MSQKRMFEIKCTECGKTTVVPFKPTVGKPVYCRECFSKRMFKQRENVGVSFSFDAKQAWARRGDSGHERKEEKPAHVF